MRNLFNNKKTRYRNLVLVLLPFVVLMFLAGFLAVKALKNTISGATGARKSYLTIESMDYHLRNDATDLQKNLFKDLKNAVEKGQDDVTIASLVGQNFVADFYTWTNKAGQADIGGLYYVYSPQKLLIFQQARDTFYHYLSTYIDRYGKENLLEVETIRATASEVAANNSYVIDGVSYPSYSVTVYWTYKNNPIFNEEDYATYSTLLLIKNADNRFEIVQMYGGD